jgi:hypothetical protein
VDTALPTCRSWSYSRDGLHVRSRWQDSNLRVERLQLPMLDHFITPTFLLLYYHRDRDVVDYSMAAPIPPPIKMANTREPTIWNNEALPKMQMRPTIPAEIAAPVNMLCLITTGISVKNLIIAYSVLLVLVRE